MVFSTVYESLMRRGFIQQVTDPEPLKKLTLEEQVTCYVGFDPTADSLHAGHLMAIMGMVQMQRHGHRPVAIIGGGTAMVGDPSGKTEMRKMLTREQIVANGKKLKQQLGRYLDFGSGEAIVVDNYEWLGSINYIEFLRDIGKHFSVNRMLTYETYKKRLETGLSFLEFNYQLLQAYDYLELFRRYDCRLQMGGDDQWANILAGADLIRRLEGADVYGLTFPLLVTATGAKMGKTESGALWLDASKTTPYDYFQYWINTDDRDVYKFLCYFTLLPMEEIEDTVKLEGSELNMVKTILAYEATVMTHGKQAADRALTASTAAFGRKIIPSGILPSSTVPRGEIKQTDDSIPGVKIPAAALVSGVRLVEVLSENGWTKSRGDARRLIQQGGVYINGEQVSDIDYLLSDKDLKDGRISIRLGKKRYYNVYCE